jgi:tetratricopeptide (TPR) repeat protein
MAGAAARKNSTAEKAKKTARSAMKSEPVHKARPSRSKTLKRLLDKKSSENPRLKTSMKTHRTGARQASKKNRRAKASVELASGNQVVSTGVSSVAEAPPRLLRDTKGTSSALALLEKAIKLIHQKDFKRARVELNNLMAAHPEEAEILVRARSYLQICNREDSVNKKTLIPSDQLYALGVLEHNRGDYQAAISYFRQAIQKHHDADYIYYSMAASMAPYGDAVAAIQNLRKAIELNEDNRVYAKNDPDFSSLYSLKEFIDLVGLNHPPARETD